MGNFKQLLEKATNSSESEPDWEVILDIIEEIKTKNVAVKGAVKDIRKRLLESDSTVVYHTLLVLDSVMKNCSSDVHSEVLTAEFMLVMKGVVTSSRDGKSGKAIDKALELIGEWKAAFGQQAGYKAVYDTFSELEKEGYHIPETEVASASFVKKAPEWVMGDRCYMCRQDFNRFKGSFRHHCRNCGKSVCAQCSSKTTALTHFGIDQPTRVCDLCYKNVDHPAAKSESGEASDDLPAEYLKSSLAQENQQPSNTQNTELKVQEDDDLQIAIAMSLNEQDNKKQSSTPAPQVTTPSAPPPAASTLYSTIVHSNGTDTSASHSTGNGHVEDTETDPNLARYLDRSYWEQRKEQQTTSAHDIGPQPVVVTTTTAPPGVAVTTGGGHLADSVSKTVEQFLARMHQVSSAGGSVATDPVVLSMFQNLTAMHPQLLKQIDEVQLKKAHQEHVLQKLHEAKQARVTLNKMRRQHLERIRQQEQEQAILGRMQMEQKLALLRQQKQEQLAYQQSLQHDRLETLQMQRTDYERQLQLQREQERQQLIAQEQQVLQQQLGVVPNKPEPVAAALPVQNLYLHDPTQAQPLPTKLQYTPSMDPPPPPYQPVSQPPQVMTLPANPQQQPFAETSNALQPLSLQDTSMLPHGMAQTLPAQTYSIQQPIQQFPPQQQPGLQMQPNSLPQQPNVVMQNLPQQPHTMQNVPQQPHSLPLSVPMIQSLPQQQPSPTQTLPQQQHSPMPQQQHTSMQSLPQQQPNPMQSSPQQQPNPMQSLPQQPNMIQGFPQQQPNLMQSLPQHSIQQFQQPPVLMHTQAGHMQAQPVQDLMGGEISSQPYPAMQPIRPRNESEPPLISFD